METKEKIQLTAGIFILLVAVGTTYFITEGDDTYYCEDTNLVGLCHKLSKVNSAGLQTRCYYNESAPTRYKNCKTGWEVFTSGLIEPKMVPEVHGLKQEVCSYSGCVPLE